MVVMKEEEEEKEEQDDLKQTSSFPPTARETAVHQTKTSHNEKKSHLSLNVCMCVYLRSNFPPSSPIQYHNPLEVQPPLFSTRPISTPS